MRRALPLWMLASLVGFSFVVPIAADAQEYVPRRARAKIDKVVVEDAPLVQIHTTFLDGRSLPVSPEKIKSAEVYCNGDSVGITSDIITFGDLQEPMDIAVVIPMTKRLPDDVREQMKEGLGSILGQLRDIDRVAAFIDDGRGIQQALLDDGLAGELIAAAEPGGGGAFLYSSLEKAIDEMVVNGNEDSRRAIILVTDGFDIDHIQPEAVRGKIMGLYEKARAENVMIFVVMYKPVISDLIPYFEGMSRKTRATYRQTSTPAGVLNTVNYVFGEIYGQLVVQFEHEDAQEGDTCAYGVSFERDFGSTVHAREWHNVTIEELQTDWWGIGIIAASIVVSLILLLIIFLIVRKILRKRKAKREEAEAEAAEAEGERPEHCQQCERSLMPDWTHCLFCGWEIQAVAAGGGLAAVAGDDGGKGKSDGGKGKSDGGKGKSGGGKSAGGGKSSGGGSGGGKSGGGGGKSDGGGGKSGGGGGKDKKKKKKKKKKDAGEQICATCGRAMLPDWEECLFCKAGIGAQG